MQDKNSIYALNKRDPDAIVYMDRGKPIRVTEEDLAAKAEFPKLKAWSDENYHETEKKNHVEGNHTVSIEGIAERFLAIEGPEVRMEREFDREQAARNAIQKTDRIQEILTRKQFKRLWRHYIEEMTEAEIAAAEKISQQAVSKSIRQAEEKIKKIFNGV